jgi:hypothetical protein
LLALSAWLNQRDANLANEKQARLLYSGSWAQFGRQLAIALYPCGCRKLKLICVNMKAGQKG